jgi:hypothetical protein
LHLGTSRFGSANVCHVFGQLQDAVEIVGVDDGCHPTAASSQVDRGVLSAGTINDLRQLLARL